MKNIPAKKLIMQKLNEVLDPELGISVVDLGLIYKVKLDKKGNVGILMTLTTMGCPLFELIREPIEKKLKAIDGIDRVEVNLTFEPPWNVEKMSKEAKIKLGFY